jgi:WD40 repeat protein
MNNYKTKPFKQFLPSLYSLLILSECHILLEFSSSGACLTCCFDDNDGNTGYSGGLDSSVSLLDLSSSRTTVLGNHEKAVSCLHYCPSIGSL